MKTMTSNDYNDLVRELTARGYLKTEDVIDSESYGFFKVVRNDDRTTKYVVEVLVWDYWIHDPERRPNDEFAYDIKGLVMCRGEELSSMDIGAFKSIDNLEHIASSFYDLCRAEDLV